jgi:hypothetical protein
MLPIKEGTSEADRGPTLIRAVHSLFKSKSSLPLFFFPFVQVRLPFPHPEPQLHLLTISQVHGHSLGCEDSSEPVLLLVENYFKTTSVGPSGRQGIFVNPPLLLQYLTHFSLIV